MPAFLIRDQVARAEAEESELQRLIDAYGLLTPAAKEKFLDHVIAGDALAVAEAAIERLSVRTRRALAERLLGSFPQCDETEGSGNDDTKH
jgi:hypothetical protein